MASTRDLIPGLGASLKRAREHRQLSVNALARLAAVSPMTVSDVENEKRAPSARVLAALYSALGVIAHVHDPATLLNPEFRDQRQPG